MKPELTLNELSLTLASDRDQARQRIAAFLQCIAQLGLIGVDGAVRISEALDGVELAPGYLIGERRSDVDVDLDLRRLYKSRIGTGPYLTDAEARSLKGGEDIEIQVQSIASRGCEAAYLLDGIALSLRSASAWDTPDLTVQINRLCVDGSIVESTEIIRHISCLDHLDHHREWIDESIADVLDDEDLWSRREVLLPHLLFAEAVKKELRVEAKQKDRFRAIVNRLRELEHYFAYWTGDQFDSNGVGSKCTPETPQTLKDHKDKLTRTCADGIDRVFNYHVRFTPGAGRIYFFPDNASRIAHVGFIREKFIV